MAKIESVGVIDLISAGGKLSYNTGILSSEDPFTIESDLFTISNGDGYFSFNIDSNAVSSTWQYSVPSATTNSISISDASIALTAALFEDRTGSITLDPSTISFLTDISGAIFDTSGARMLGFSGGETSLELDIGSIFKLYVPSLNGEYRSALLLSSDQLHGFCNQKYTSIDTADATPTVATTLYGNLIHPTLHKVYISARNSDYDVSNPSNTVAFWEINFLRKTENDTTVIIGSTSSVSPDFSDAGYSALTIDIDSQLQVTVTGIAATDITWEVADLTVTP